MSNLRDKVIDYYQILLAIGWLVMDDDGNVSVNLGDELRPATIDGKRMIVPTREQMKNPNWDNRIGFHPLRESFNLGISDVMANLRDQYVDRLNVSIGYFMKELIAIAHDTAGQKNLTSEQGQVLNALPHCGDSTVKTFESILKKTRAANNADQFINIFMRKGGLVNGKTYGRAGIITFPIYQKLVDGEEKINGVKVSAKDRDMFIKLFRFIFPNIENKEYYNEGVNTKTAPFLEALIRVTFNVVDDLVDSSKPYMPIIPVPYFLTFPEDMGIWKEIFDSPELFERLAATIPNLSRGEEAPVEKPERAEPSRREESRDREPEDRKAESVQTNLNVDVSKPRGRMIMGAPAGTPPPPMVGKSGADRDHPKPSNDRPIVSGRGAVRDSDLDRMEEKKRREEADAERRRRDAEEAEDRILRQKRREEDDRLERERERLREKQRELDREADRLTRGGGRDDRDDRDRDRDRGRGRDDRDRDEPRRTGDPFEDNPALRENLRDEDDRGRGRYRDDDRDRGRDRGRRIPDMRDGGQRGRDRYDDRDRGRGRDYERDRDYDRNYERDRGRYRR